MSALRSDAARSRSRILEAAGTHATDDLRLNEIAREAGVGVATVYRHFPTVRALVEALTAGSLDRLLTLAREAAAEPDPGTAFTLFLRGTLTLQLDDDGLQPILVTHDDEGPETSAVKAEIVTTAATVLDRAKAAGAVRGDVTLDQLQHLVCGIEHAVRLGLPEDRGPLLEILVAGLRPA